MKKNVAILISLSFMIGLLFQFCKKETIADQSIVKYDKFSLINGYLAFNSQEDFDEVTKSLYTMQDKLDEWEANIQNFTSMRTAYKSITAEKAPELIDHLDSYKYLFSLVEENSGERSIERNVDNDVMATIINKDGLFQIGNKVYRFTRNHYYTTNVETIDLLMKNNIISGTTGIETFDIKRETILSDATMTDDRAQNWAECTTTSGNLRVKGIIEVEDLTDNDCNIITKHQKKVLGIWWANSTSISVTFSGTFCKIWGSCSPSPHATFGGTLSSSNNSSISLTVPGNSPLFNGCNGSAVPFHDGLYGSTHTAGGKTCRLSCPPGSPCQ